jgi:dihydrolipoamide dehydrogenase
MRTNVPNIFAIGDIVGQPMLAHKAVHEAHVAAEAAAGEKVAFDARVIPSVAYTDPEVAWVGLTEDQAKAQGIAIKKGHFPWTASGRAIANGRDEGFTKLLFDASSTHRILGGGIVGTHAGDMIGEVALAIEMGADEVDIGKTIHPHPTLGESIGMAAEIAHGTCTDVPPPRKCTLGRWLACPVRDRGPGVRQAPRPWTAAVATAAPGGRRRSGAASSCTPMSSTRTWAPGLGEWMNLLSPT